MNFFATDSLIKMRLIACQDEDYQTPVGDPFELQINPAEYQKNYRAEYAASQTQGHSGQQQEFIGILSDEFNLEFTLDSTGVVANGIEALGIGGLFEEEETIPRKIDRLKTTFFKVQGDLHQPNYVKIIWGDEEEIFKGVLEDLEVSYTLFAPSGTPLRAKVKAKFMSHTSVSMEQSITEPGSPDLTHERLVQEGDHLPLMCHRIYGDSRYYLEVARVNGIVNFRNLKAGSIIYFPPIEK